MADGAWPRVLLVEGPEDVHFFVHLAKRHGLPLYDERSGQGATDGVVIRSFDGKDNLGQVLRATLLNLELESVGIVMDADASAGGRWRSVRDLLQGLDLPVVDQPAAAPEPYRLPGDPREDGTVVLHGHLPTIGIWLMPDNREPGMLEDFIRFLVPAEDRLWPAAEQVVDDIRDEDRAFIEADAPKARLHTWLAWQAEPGTPIGLAVTRRFLDTDVPEATMLLDWLRRLFWPDRNRR